MRRGLDCGETPAGGVGKRQRRQVEGGEEDGEMMAETAFVNLDEDLLFEVLKHVDARTLATAACVSRQWKRTAHDERLWEMICTRHWANVGCGTQQLRSVVLALGGFRRLHALCLWPLLKSPLPPPPPPPLTQRRLTLLSPPHFLLRWSRQRRRLLAGERTRFIFPCLFSPFASTRK
ncbi:F-box protein GID2 [Vitis vinifera]|uniref:F-box protein GID2 n=1 Tax=Vitis vinifera TaxID=29760 RepID=A0A438FB85_VITVI|nr:F-box protein GID2 [Vitis vinifera]